MASQLVYVSVVGSQALGTLEGLLALSLREGPMPVRLLPTSKTLGVAERIAEYIETAGLGEPEIIPVNMDAAGEGSAPVAIAGIAREAQAQGKRICINIDGGMNFLIAAIALALEGYHPLYIQSARDRVVLTDTADETHHALRLPQPLSPLDILELQGVEFEADARENPDANPDLPLRNIFAREGVKLPANVLTNVRIDNLVFDYVWNPGNNRLSFFKDWRFKVNDNKRKERDRDFAQWSKDRRRCKQLYDKRIYALLWGHKSDQRLSEDSNGQIRTIFYKRPDPRNPKAVSEAAAEINGLFSEKPPKVRERKLDIPKVSPAAPLRDDTLVVCMGRDLPSTLTAIASHRPKHVLLAFARGDDLVKTYAERVTELAAELGVESVELADFRIEGIYADHVLPQAGLDKPLVRVNITPGTKGQGTMLARWAARNGHEVWSLHGRDKLCVPLLAPEGAAPLPLQICDSLIMFKLLGREIQDEGTRAQELAADFGWMDALLAFMREIAAAGLDINEAFLKGELRHGRNRLKKIGSDEWRLTMAGSDYFFSKAREGAWFERLCARALMNAGAEHVRLNLKLAWNERNLAAVLREYGPSSNLHQRELDVVGSWEGKLVLLSAKSYELREQEDRKNCIPLDEAVADAQTTANIMDKFALSLLSHMGATKAVSGDRVALIGWRELCDPQKLAMQIRNLAFSLSTTEQ